MKLIAIFCFVACICTALCLQRLCLGDEDCKWNECCVTKFTGDKLICKDMGDDIGDVCGGSYFCGRCSRNLTCVTKTEVPILDGYNCPLPANGTCECLGGQISPKRKCLLDVVLAPESISEQIQIENPEVVPAKPVL